MRFPTLSIVLTYLLLLPVWAASIDEAIGLRQEGQALCEQGLNGEEGSDDLWRRALALFEQATQIL